MASSVFSNVLLCGWEMIVCVIFLQDGWSALHHAAQRYECEELIQTLLKNGANPDLKDKVRFYLSYASSVRLGHKGHRLPGFILAHYYFLPMSAYLFLSAHSCITRSLLIHTQMTQRTHCTCKFLKRRSIATHAQWFYAPVDSKLCMQRWSGVAPWWQVSIAILLLF